MKRPNADPSDIGLLCFDEARQRFLAALREMLADRSITDTTKASEAWASISAIAQLTGLTEVDGG